MMDDFEIGVTAGHAAPERWLSFGFNAREDGTADFRFFTANNPRLFTARMTAAQAMFVEEASGWVAGASERLCILDGLHQPDEFGVCVECEKPYPCMTAKALRGDF